MPLTLAALGIVAVGAVIPATPLAGALGLEPLRGAYFAALAGMVAGYLVLFDVGKRIFYGAAASSPPARRAPRPHRHLRRRAARFSTAAR